MNIKFISSLILSSFTFNLIEGHGYLSSPRSRNFYANEEGLEGSHAGVPPKEYEPQSISSKQANQVCGTKRQNYDNYKDSRGNSMPWIPQGVYTDGGEIDIEFTLTANHWGHIEIYVCPDGDASDQDCFVRNPAIMVEDLKYNGPRDPTYPERGYIGSHNLETFKFKYRLPEGVTGNQVMMQWRYVTANSCLPKGYRDIPELITRGWAQTQLGNCNWPLNWTGDGMPEQFFNCAEIQINNSNGPSPVSAPVAAPIAAPVTAPAITPVTAPATAPATAPVKAPVEAPVKAPVEAPVEATCGNGKRGNGICPKAGTCCSKWGWCGTSTSHCTTPAPVPAPVAAPVPAPTEVIVATCGNGKRGNGICPKAGTCCSKWGWCGYSTWYC